jgi:hypothetical protein
VAPALDAFVRDPLADVFVEETSRKMRPVAMVEPPKA